MVQEAVLAHSLLTDYDVHLLREGKHFKLYEKLGSHPLEVEEQRGTYFAVWAPNAQEVSVIGDFNHWQKSRYKLFNRWDSSGIWEGFIPGVFEGAVYKYALKTPSGQWLEKGDPFAREWEVPPATASVVRSTFFEWSDQQWMKKRKKHNSLQAPIAVYEMHLGSWKRRFDEQQRSFTYRELAQDLVPYLSEMGFTHVEFMPVMEHPFFGSWGYQITGYFAPTSRYGGPADFAFLVNELHRAGIGVFLDWVPSHFPNDAHGLFRFDGTSLYEHEDPRLGYHPDWSSYIFNYGRNEVRSFLISNALFWLGTYHADGLRVDAVASMLYLDYSRKEGQWIPNRFGGRENLEAISFLRELNSQVYSHFPDVQTIAEESTSWPMVSRPVSDGGLGFGLKWMMGWMNDILEYFKKDGIYRRFHQNMITFSLVYAFNENFMLPLSHDEVVHGKGSLLSRMPGDEWQRFANLRALYCWMYFHPGSKLLFMGAEFAQFSEWKHDEALLWNLLSFKYHQGVQLLVRDLNLLFTSQGALYELNYSHEGFEWIDYSDAKNSVVAFYRKGKKKNGHLLILGNFTASAHEQYEVGVAQQLTYSELLNSDSETYGGSGHTNQGLLSASPGEKHGLPYTLALRLPPMGFTVLQPRSTATRKKKV